MPIQAPQWTEFLSCPVCCNAFDITLRSPISLGCGHTVCKACLSNLHRKQCPFDQTTISIDIESLPVNSALLQLVSPTNSRNKDYNNDVVDQKVVSRDNVVFYQDSKKCVEDLAMYLKPQPNGNVCSSSGILSRPMQRKLVTLINCQLVEEEGRTRAMRAARSLGERTVTELILQHQNPQQLSANLWAAVRARGCQFLGPAMQEEVLKLVLLALEDGSALSRKVLVMFVVQRLEPHYPQASKTSIGHVVQLLYRASCFKVSKREGDSSLMQLKEEFRTYEALRREHDAQIVQIATEAGLRIAPDQWSALLYGDTAHKSHMQSIIDKLQTPQSFAQSVQELVIALQRTGDPGKLSILRQPLELLAAIDPSPESSTPSWDECNEALKAVRQVVAGLVEFIHQHGSRKLQETNHSQHAKYKISMCRDLTLRGNCPRGTNCTFAHSNEELDKYRAKNRKIIRNKEHRSDNNPSPIAENVYQQNDDMNYMLPNTTTVSPVPIPNVVQIQRIGYDVTFNNYSTSAPPFAGGGAAMYTTVQSGAYLPRECAVYPTTASGNVVVANTPDQFYQQQQQQQNNEYLGQERLEIKSPSNWDIGKIMLSPPAPSVHSNTKQMRSTKSLNELHQRRQEVILQLEKVVGKPTAIAISNKAASLAIQESQQQDGPTSPYTFWMGNYTAPTFVRSDSILAADDDYVPSDSPAISKYGPISRMAKDNGQISNSNFNSAMLRKPMPSPTALQPFYFNNNSAFNSGLNHSIGNNGMGPSQLILHQRSPDPSKDLIAESQRVQLQLYNLEKQLNDLKLVTQGMTLSEQDRLTRELNLIEQGIQEKHKEACLQKIVQSWNQQFNNQNFGNNEEEAMYEADIANDMKKLEMRLQEEIEEQEKAWSSEDDSNQ